MPRGSGQLTHSTRRPHHHAFLLGRVDAISADIAALDDRIAEQAAPLADAVARLGRDPGDQPIPGSGSAGAGRELVSTLTEREAEVLACLGEGLSNAR